ncbi:hypothetical protein LPJ66_010702, partial [Kickxella alabastrina]
AAEDSAAVRALCSGADGALGLGAAELVRSRALRQGDARELVAALGDAADLAQRAVPALLRGAQPEAAASWDSVAVLASAMGHFASAGAGAAAAGDVLGRCFGCVDAVVRAACVPLDAAAAYMPAAEAQLLATRLPAAVFRLAAQTARAAHSISDGQAQQTAHPWFATLRALLACRLFSLRMQDAALRDSLALLVGSLWTLAQPSLSRWSASFDDYFALDEIEALAGAYGGTGTAADTVLLRVIREYEAVTRQSVQRVALVFGPTAAQAYLRERLGRAQYLIERDENVLGEVADDTVAAALASVDPARMLRSMVEFPVHSLFEPRGDAAMLELIAAAAADGPVAVGDRAAENYDAQFIVPWLWALVSGSHAIDLRRLIESNSIGMAIVALSSANLPMRKLAFFVMDCFYAKIAASDNTLHSGQRQCVLLLDALRNAITDRSDDNFPRLPLSTTLFVATSLPIMLHPEHAMFSDINRLLLKRPFLDLGEVPLLRSTLRSSAAGARRQRVHLIRVAAQSARDADGSAKWLRRSDLVNVVLALAANPLGDVLTGRSALTLLFHLTGLGNPKSLVRHVSKGGVSLVAWIRAQVGLELNSLSGMAAQIHMEKISIGGGSGAGTGGGQEFDGSLVVGVRASLVNLTALVRIVLRAVANYPLTQLREGLVFNKFWAIQGQEQAAAVGQSAVLEMCREILHVLVSALLLIHQGGGSSVNLEEETLALVAVCLDSTALLVSMQQQQQQEQTVCSLMPVRQVYDISGSVLDVLRVIEPRVSLDSDTVKDAHLGNSGSSSGLANTLVIARAVSVESLFDTLPSRVVYPEIVKTLVALCLNSHFASLTRAPTVVARDVVERALVVGVPEVVRAIGCVIED